MDKLTNARKAIEEIDLKMAELFIKRMECVKTISEYKMANGLAIYDPEREQTLLNKNGSYVNDHILRKYYLTFCKETMKISRQYQEHLSLIEKSEGTEK
jgi:monofunctional chorismate mutase